MSVLRPDSVWIDARGKEFRVMHEKDGTVWYSYEDVTYSCRTEAFQERFKLQENYK